MSVRIRLCLYVLGQEVEDGIKLFVITIGDGIDKLSTICIQDNDETHISSPSILS